MRIGLGTALLLAASSLVGLTQSPVAAATGCEAPDTTWLGPATEGGSVSWAEPANWTNDVPTATSVVCIPDTPTGPRVLEGTQAHASVVTLDGALTVETSLDVMTLDGTFGELQGPGTVTVTGRLSGYWLTLRDAAEVSLRGDAALGGELFVSDGSRLTVESDSVLEPGARIDSLSGNPGLFTVAEGASLTFDTPNESAEVIGGFANHGTVTVTAGHVLMMGADTADAHPAQFSTGTFTGAPAATFNVSNTELRSGALLDQVTWVDHITVPSGSTVTAAASGLVDFPDSNEPPPPSFLGAGELVVTDGSSLNYASVGGSLTVTVPVGEVLAVGHAAVAGHARLKVDGELAQWSDIDLDDDAVLDIYGTHRAVAKGGGVVDFTGTDPGLEIIRSTGRLLSDEGGAATILVPVVNHGTVDSGTGFIYLGPRAASPSPSSGTFRADPAGTLLLGSNEPGAPPLALDGPVVDGAVDVSGEVVAESADLRGELSTVPGGSLSLDGTTSMADGSGIAGDVTVTGQLQADLGPTGTASLTGADVAGEIVVISGRLSVPSLAPTTLAEDGTLAVGQWRVWPDATLDLPAVTTIDAELVLHGPGASFGDGLTSLTRIGPNGTLLSDGVDVAVPGPLRNEGMLGLMPGSRLDVGGKFRQLTTGTLYTGLDATGRGRVRAAGPRDLAGTLEVDRDPGYTPPVGTVLRFITSDGRRGADDAFDRVVSPRYGSRKIRVDYGLDQARLRVDRVG